MELTQIKWENVWKKISIQDWWNKIEAEKNLIADSKLAHFAEIEKEAWWVAKISASHEEHNVKVNWRKVPVNQSRKVEPWDTVSFWENKENIFAVHEKWEKIAKDDVKNHLEKAWHEVSDEEFKDILEKLNIEQKVVRWLFVWLLVVSIFLSWTIFYLNSQNNLVSKKIYETLNSKDKQIQELKDLVWQNPEIECDPETENWCPVKWDLFSKISKLEKENQDLSKKISDPKNQKKLEEKISKLEEKFSEKEKSWEKINFDEDTKKELSKIISSVVEEMNSFKPEVSASENIENKVNTEKISQLEWKISEIQKNLSWEDLDFWKNWEKVGQAVKILLNKIMELQKEVNSLK